MQDKLEPVEASDIIDMIRSAKAEDIANLRLIAEAVKEQLAYLARKQARQLKPGDTITFAAHIRPHYLAGLTATVKDFNRTSIVVACPVDPRYGRFSGSRGVRLPVGLIA